MCSRSIVRVRVPIKAEGTFDLLGSLFMAYNPLKTFLVLGCVFSTWSISKVFIEAL